MAYDPKLGYDPNKDYSLAIVNAGSDEERERLRQERQQLRVQPQRQERQRVQPGRRPQPRRAGRCKPAGP